MHTVRALALSPTRAPVPRSRRLPPSVAESASGSRARAASRVTRARSPRPLQLCVTAQMPVENGGAEGKVLIIDTENNFRPDRIRQIATERGMDADQTCARRARAARAPRRARRARRERERERAE